ncbi:chemotaxis protein CheW [Methylomonas fluvii]|uniref:Chemotaxis protein CheW n=1 Tax=Methylomonas fluvii TaxID=1854564 RepID=A0ABR9DFR3_9GAMM|nr:chemotaxis protein CheW [Methylomonas fluvii]MBD9361163.1 chemotaxis protein CheW [Methylomonas fluvii]CAD6874073.1 Positive regulator of CheA protein activity (CheW) [Methylomonas fluvii]
MSEIIELSITDQQDAKRLDTSLQFLSFTLGQEEYGVDILRVQEIRSWEPVSRIPNVPAYEKGVVNLRGAIVPIIDLRERFQLGHSDYSPLTVVVVLQARMADKTRIIGVVVDSVSDVVDVNKKSIQSAPNFGAKVSTEFINGLVSVNGRMVMLLDVDKLLKLDGLDGEDES